MSEPIARRNVLVDYRISTMRCADCGKVYFPPKSFCDLEGRDSTMLPEDYFYKQGELFSGTMIATSTNKFKHLGPFLTGIIQFPEEGFKVPGRITDRIPCAEGGEIHGLIGRGVVPRFRRNYADGDSGLVYYSSLNFSLEGDYYPYQEFETIKPSDNIGPPGIVGYGAYLPKFRIKNEPSGILGVKERTVPFMDEDTVTFAVEAGKRALIHSALSNRLIRKCFVGTESPAYAVKPIMATVIQALELGIAHDGGFYSGGVDTQFACKAASDLFIDAAALVDYSKFEGDYVMVIGADNSQAAPGDALDSTVGAGGSAFIIGKRDVIATLDHYVSYTSDTPDFYRREGQRYPRHGGRFTGKPAYYKHTRNAMDKILEKSSMAPGDFAHIVLHSPNGVFPLRVATEIGFKRDQIDTGLVVTRIGNLYSGSTLTGLAAVLDIADPGERILMVSYGSGAGSDAYIFTVTEQILEKRGRLVRLEEQIESPLREYIDYSTYRKMKEIS
jgi:hydroxymethylglutaryl-CoA synthase